MAVKKKEEPKNKTTSKLEKMLARVEESRKLAEKSGEPISFGRVEDFTDAKRDGCIMTGMLGIDLNTNGIYRGVVGCIWGENQTGKTTAILAIIEGIQMTNPDAIFQIYDTEQTLDKTYLDRFPHLDHSKIFIEREIKIEAVIDHMREVTGNNEVDYIIWDSYDTTVSKTTLDKSFETDNQQVMGKATVLSQGMHEIQNNMKKFGQSMIILQQVKQGFSKQGMQAFDKRAGGNTLLHAPSWVLKLSQLKDGSVLNSDGSFKIKYIKIKNEKSKVSSPYKTTQTYINCFSGSTTAIDRVRELVEYAKEYDLIVGRSWYEWTDINGELQKVHGKDAIIPKIKEDLDTYSLLKLFVYAKALDPDVFISRFDHIIELLIAENSKTKQNKIRVLQAMKKPHLITAEDSEILAIPEMFNSSEKVLGYVFPEQNEEYLNENPEYMSGKQKFEYGSFKLLSKKEQDEKIEKETETTEFKETTKKNKTKKEKTEEIEYEL